MFPSVPKIKHWITPRRKFASELFLVNHWTNKWIEIVANLEIGKCRLIHMLSCGVFQFYYFLKYDRICGDNSFLINIWLRKYIGTSSYLHWSRWSSCSKHKVFTSAKASYGTSEMAWNDRKKSRIRNGMQPYLRRRTDSTNNKNGMPLLKICRIMSFHGMQMALARNSPGQAITVSKSTAMGLFLLGRYVNVLLEAAQKSCPL